MTTITDAATAERLLRNALAGTPELTTEQVADLLAVAVSLDELGDPVYTGAALDRAAALGWSWKSALTADKYDLGGGPGRALSRSQWFAHCERKRAQYASGEASVVGDTSPRRGGIGSIGLMGSLATTTETVWPPYVGNAPEPED